MPKYPKEIIVQRMEPDDGSAAWLNVHEMGATTDAEDGALVAVYELVQVSRVHRSVSFEVVEDAKK